MYTGITQGLYPVKSVKKSDNFLTYVVELDDRLMQDLQIGASVSVDGVCQTVVSIHNNQVTFNAIDETLRKTTLADLETGDKVSIERSATANAEMGGHCMYGHVYGMAEVVNLEKSENNLKLTFKCPNVMMLYLFEKGFVGINGSSLTVNDVNLTNDTFSVNLIPHTLLVTDFSNKKVGSKVNIELDATTVTIVETIKRLNETGMLRFNSLKS